MRWPLGAHTSRGKRPERGVRRERVVVGGTSSGWRCRRSASGRLSVRIMRSPLAWIVLLGVLVVCPSGPARATLAEPFDFENAEVATVVKHVGRLTGLTFLFDP